MSEINSNKDIKMIAFYLPQYHSIPENDQWWGKDFTEWTNVKKAQPLFDGHIQPRIPLNSNYYNLLDDEVKIWQANIAKEYGVYGFCYYHYWFKGGKKLLEQPAEQMLKNKEINQPFCFCWANENWTRNWDGGNREVIIEQEYGNEQDWEQHFMYLLDFFKDDRYITVDGKPLFVIYKPELITHVYQMCNYFRKRAKQEGFPDLCLAFQFPSYYSDIYYRNDIFDYRIEFEPVFSRSSNQLSKSKKVELFRKYLNEDLLSKYRDKRKWVAGSFAKPKHLSMFFYDEAWERILNQEWSNDFIPGTFVDWDNTPRNKHGVVYNGYSTQKFEENLIQLLTRMKKENKNFLFINAWNEWGEGAYLEPDEYFKYSKLEAIKKAMELVNTDE